MNSLYTLQLTNVSKHYNINVHGGKSVIKAVDGVTLSLEKESKTCIVGASGSGKTTLLKLIVGEILPTAGSVDLRATIGFVAQDPYSSLCHAMTIHDIIAEPMLFGKKPFKREDLRAKVAQAMNWVNLAYCDFAGRYPHQLSGGERGRVGIARALIARPEILIMDEPTAMLDYEAKAHIAQIVLRATLEVGNALLVVTHDIEFAALVCDDMYVMKDGRIVEFGRTGEVLARPKDVYTKRLVLAGTDIFGYWEGSGQGQGQGQGI